MPTDPQAFTLAEAAQRLGIGRSTAYEVALRAEFPIPVLTIGRSKRVSRRQLEAFIEGTDTAEDRRRRQAEGLE